MPNDLPGLAPTPSPTAHRPLMGVTLLAVEDSRAASEAVRLMALRSGARLRRADSLQSARRHLRIYRPTVVLVDLGLPDGKGAELIAELAAAGSRVDAIIATSGAPEAEREAMAAGADAFLAKPVVSVAGFQEAVVANLPAEAQPSGPRAVPDEVLPMDAAALRDDLARAAELLSEPAEAERLAYVAQFLESVGRDAGDAALGEAAGALRATVREPEGRDAALARLRDLVETRRAEMPAV